MAKGQLRRMGYEDGIEISIKRHQRIKRHPIQNLSRRGAENAEENQKLKGFSQRFLRLCG